MIDENGGYILWVRRGLGEYAGWVNAFNSIASNVCDLPTYPVLFCRYVHVCTQVIAWRMRRLTRAAVLTRRDCRVRAVYRL